MACPRSRYRADRLLDELTSRAGANLRVVVGLTAKDISTTKGGHKDWGIFGLGELGGQACVVSTYRLSARGADEKQLCERLVKVAIHEAGHVMGLDHCPHAGCVMRDAEASIATVDGATGAFCASCKQGCVRWLSAPSVTHPAGAWREGGGDSVSAGGAAGDAAEESCATS